VIYIDRLGHENVLRWFEVVTLVDCPEPDDVGNGYGFCAADRAYDQIKALAALESYHYEKLTGNTPTAIHLINGLNQTQLDDILADAEDEQAEQGRTQFMGAIIATLLKPDATPAVATIQLAGLPDNTNPTDVRGRADLVYANALGMDLNEISPHGSQTIGAGATSQVQHQKAKDKGVISFRQQLIQGVNWEICDTRSRFYFNSKDLVDEERMARIAAAYSTAAQAFITNGVLSPKQAQEWLIENEVIPQRFAERNTVSNSLLDSDKPGLLDAENRDIKGTDQPVTTFFDPTKPPPVPVGPGQDAPGPNAGMGDVVPTTPKPEIIDQTSSSRTNTTEEPQKPKPATKEREQRPEPPLAVRYMRQAIAEQ
jgi:hypothetical protein